MSASQVLTEEQKAEFRELASSGARNTHLALRYGLHVQTIAKYRERLGCPPAPIGRIRVNPIRVVVPRVKKRDVPTTWRCEDCQQLNTTGYRCARCVRENPESAA